MKTETKSDNGAMKTHHFIIKDGHLYVIPEMPEKPWTTDYELALDRAKESALLVENKERVIEAIQGDRYFLGMNPKVGQLYPLECQIEVREVEEFPGFDHTSYPTFKQIALITFSEHIAFDRTSFEEQNAEKYIAFMKNTYGDKDFVRAEEQVERQDRHERILQIANQLWEKWVLIYEDRAYMTKDLFTLAIQDEILKELHGKSSPAHADNQEELWNEVSQWFGIETYAASSIRELQNRFTVTRKQK